MASFFTKPVVFAAIGGVLVGALVIVGIRFATYSPEHVHYHANFAVYINGKREEFKDKRYYQEVVGSCTTDDITPLERAHMHDNVGDIVHVHDHAVSWGQFFQNLGWSVNSKLIQTPDKLYQADDTNNITFMLNGQKVSDITGQVIGNEDRLLVDFGDTSSDTIKKEFDTVASTAAKQNQSTDPASCGGNAAPTFTERLQHLF